MNRRQQIMLCLGTIASMVVPVPVSDDDTMVPNNERICKKYIPDWLRNIPTYVDHEYDSWVETVFSNIYDTDMSSIKAGDLFTLEDRHPDRNGHFIEDGNTIYIAINDATTCNGVACVSSAIVGCRTHPTNNINI